MGPLPLPKYALEKASAPVKIHEIVRLCNNQHGHCVTEQCTQLVQDVYSYFTNLKSTWCSVHANLLS